MNLFVDSGILLYEMLYGYTPFRGKTRQRTFANILHKDIRFPASISVSKSSVIFFKLEKLNRFEFSGQPSGKAANV